MNPERSGGKKRSNTSSKIFVLGTLGEEGKEGLGKLRRDHSPRTASRPFEFLDKLSTGGVVLLFRRAC